MTNVKETVTRIGIAKVPFPVSIVTATNLFLSVDEDQPGDTERSHTSEQVAFMAFATPVAHTAPGSRTTRPVEFDP